jgi:hypothetical protein
MKGFKPRQQDQGKANWLVTSARRTQLVARRGSDQRALRAVFKQHPWSSIYSRRRTSIFNAVWWGHKRRIQGDQRQLDRGVLPMKSG